ncbi:MAG TPA: peptidoglycan DD-metalloendopeptidase family protein [Spirochaetota bacterium]|nr:peptidoglycan DD-metalloendopeptidase family protein [Spirochaetota bacterium]
MVNKVIAGLIVMTMVSLPVFAENSTKPRNKYQRAVDSQKSEDKKRKDELVAKMKNIIGSLNTRLKKSGIEDADLDVPIDMDSVEDISENSDSHAKDAEKPKVYAFTTDDSMLYSSSDASSIVGKVSFAEKVEVLEKIEGESEFKGRSGQWMAVRRDNGNEGWIHSSLLAKTKPEKRKITDEEGEYGALSFDAPVSGKSTSPFGSRIDPVTKKRNAFHSGVDIAAPQGTPVKAASGGIVRKTEYNKNGYGKLIVIEHEKDFSTYYGHLSKIEVNKGQTVKKGDNIGAVGSTGKSTGPHLHFEVRRGEKALDPDAYIR